MSSFDRGMKLGSDAWDSARELEIRQRAADQQFRLGQQTIDANDRTARINRSLDDEREGINSYMKNGAMTGNTTGMADGQARAFADAGGQGYVDTVARLNNDDADMVSGGQGMRYKTSEPGAPTTTFRPYDASSTTDREAIEQRIGRIAALTGDMTALRASQDNIRTIREEGTFNDAVKKFKDDPESAGDYMRWLNKNNPAITIAPQYSGEGKNRKLTGYNTTVVGPAGDATHTMISPDQGAILAGATALMNTNPTKALAMIGTVNKDLAAVVQGQNALVQQSVTGNNSATHYFNTDANGRISANAAAASAGAAVKNANTMENYRRDSQMPLGATDDGKGLIYSNGGKLEVRGLPEGVDGATLFKKVTGVGGGAAAKQLFANEKDISDGTTKVGPDGVNYKWDIKTQAPRLASGMTQSEFETKVTKDKSMKWLNDFRDQIALSPSGEEIGVRDPSGGIVQFNARTEMDQLKQYLNTMRDSERGAATAANDIASGMFAPRSGGGMRPIKTPNTMMQPDYSTPNRSAGTRGLNLYSN